MGLKDRLSIGAGRVEPGWVVGAPPKLEAAGTQDAGAGRGEAKSWVLLLPLQTSQSEQEASIDCFRIFLCPRKRILSSSLLTHLRISPTNIYTALGPEVTVGTRQSLCTFGTDILEKGLGLSPQGRVCTCVHARVRFW